MPASLPRRILIVRMGAIGDVVNALVLAAAVKRADPAVRIGWAVHPLSEPLVVRHPAVDRVHVWKRGGGIAEWRRIVREVREERYELAIDLQRLAKSAQLARFSGAERVLGFDRARTKEGSFLLTRERSPAGDAGAHMVEQYLEFARYLGLDVARAELRLPIDPEAEHWAQSWVREHGAPVLLNMGASKPRKLWPPERFGELARALLADQHTPVAFNGSPQDVSLAQRALATAGRRDGLHDLAGRTSLLQLAALQRRSRAVVACDTGPMHMAVACGARVVAVFGPGEPRRTGPYLQLERVVRRRHDGSAAGLEKSRVLRIEDVRVEHVLEALTPVLSAGVSR
jgi:heptosyltransferase-1